MGRKRRSLDFEPVIFLGDKGFLCESVSWSPNGSGYSEYGRSLLNARIKCGPRGYAYVDAFMNSVAQNPFVFIGGKMIGMTWTRRNKLFRIHKASDFDATVGAEIVSESFTYVYADTFGQDGKDVYKTWANSLLEYLDKWSYKHIKDVAWAMRIPDRLFKARLCRWPDGHNPVGLVLHNILLDGSSKWSDILRPIDPDLWDFTFQDFSF